MVMRVAGREHIEHDADIPFGFSVLGIGEGLITHAESTQPGNHCNNHGNQKNQLVGFGLPRLEEGPGEEDDRQEDQHLCREDIGGRFVAKMQRSDDRDETAESACGRYSR